MTTRDLAPLRSPRGRRFSGRVPVGLAAAALTVVICTAACSASAPTVPSEAPGPAGSATASPAADPSASAPADPASADPGAGAVEAALRSLLASTPQPSTAQIRESLSGAGFAPAAVEVSASRTPTGLAADAVEVGVLGEAECVMAQIRSGTVESSVLPVLPNGRCFIGSVQR